MKRNRTMMLAGVAGALTLAGSALAFPGMHGGPGQGSGNCCSQPMCCDQQPEMTAAHKTFIKETLPLRKEMMEKRLAIQKEFSEDKPDQTKITALRKEMMELRKKMMDARAKAGLPMGKMGPKGRMQQGGRNGGMNGCGQCW